MITVCSSSLNTVLKDLGLDKAVRNKKLGVTLVDITDLEEPLVASVNGDTMLYAASLPKIAILMGCLCRNRPGQHGIWMRIPALH